MAHADIAQQTLVEHGMLKCITDALRIAISWKLEGPDILRKLSTVRFITRSLQHHLDHLLALEEYDGYMGVVLKLSPASSRQVDALRQEHDEFRKETSRLVHRLEHLSPTDRTTFDHVCNELLVLLGKVDEHSRRETDLLQETFDREGGGQG